MTPRCYSFDSEMLAALEDAKDAGLGKAEATRRLCKAGLDRVTEEGWDALPEDEPRKFNGPQSTGSLEANRHTSDEVGGESVGSSESGGSSDSRALPGLDDSVGTNGTPEAHEEAPSNGQGARENGNQSESKSIIPWFR